LQDYERSEKELQIREALWTDLAWLKKLFQTPQDQWFVERGINYRVRKLGELYDSFAGDICQNYEKHKQTLLGKRQREEILTQASSKRPKLERVFPTACEFLEGLKAKLKA
jgi:hypothetical protein